MLIQSVSAWILDHYACACACVQYVEPMSILFGSLQHVGGLLALTQKKATARLEGASASPCVGSISLLSRRKRMRLEEP